MSAGFVPYATNTTPGVVQPDGTTITAGDDGVISATGGGGGGGSGTVTSVSASVPADESVTVSTPTSTPEIAITRNAQSGNTVLASPSGGGSGTPGFRSLVAADIPSLPASQLGSGQLAQARGGTGIDTSGATDGQLLIGQSSDHSLGLATLTAGSGVTITNSGHAISIAASGGGGGSGTVTDVTGTAPINVASGTSTPVVSISTFAASGSGHAAGAVPDPGSTAGTTRYLREDATWDAPPTVDMPYVLVEEHETSGTSGGGSTPGSWQTRVLNTIVADSAGIASLASNQVTLPAGTYRVRATSAYCQAGSFQIRIQNITAGTTLATGQNEYMAFVALQSHAVLNGRFTLSTSSAVALQYRCSVSVATEGLGIATSWGTEIYSSVVFEKE